MRGLAITLLIAGLCACQSTRPVEKRSPVPPPTTGRTQCSEYQAMVQLAMMKGQALRHGRGLAPYSKDVQLFWTLINSRDRGGVYVFDRQGKERAAWRVNGAQAVDWEDLATGPGPQAGQVYLYAGDIGDDVTTRDEITIYRFIEPTLSTDDKDASREDLPLTEAAEAIRIRYPDGRYNAETLIVHPQTGDLYIITRPFPVDRPAQIYKLAVPFPTGTATLTRIGEINAPPLRKHSSINNQIAGGDISSDGRRVILCDRYRAYELCLPEGAKSFDEIWQQPLSPINLSDRPTREGICYRLDGNSLLTITTEGRSGYFEEVVRKP